MCPRVLTKQAVHRPMVHCSINSVMFAFDEPTPHRRGDTTSASGVSGNASIHLKLVTLKSPQNSNESILESYLFYSREEKYDIGMMTPLPQTHRYTPIPPSPPSDTSSSLFTLPTISWPTSTVSSVIGVLCVWYWFW